MFSILQEMNLPHWVDSVRRVAEDPSNRAWLQEQMGKLDQAGSAVDEILKCSSFEEALRQEADVLKSTSVWVVTTCCRSAGQLRDVISASMPPGAQSDGVFVVLNTDKECSASRQTAVARMMLHSHELWTSHNTHVFNAKTVWNEAYTDDQARPLALLVALAHHSSTMLRTKISRYCTDRSNRLCRVVSNMSRKLRTTCFVNAVRRFMAGEWCDVWS